MTTCKNIWHRSPGAMLMCPTCKMTVSEWRAENKPQLAANDGPQGSDGQERSERDPRIPSGARLQARTFIDPDPAIVIDVMNKWLNTITKDGRINVVNSESISHAGNFVMTVFFTVHS